MSLGSMFSNKRIKEDKDKGDELPCEIKVSVCCLFSVLLEFWKILLKLCDTDTESQYQGFCEK